jgi:hypothetical protein
MEEPRDPFVRHVSSDGRLVWLAERYLDQSGDYDFSFGFWSDGSFWHGHPDVVEGEPGRTREQIVRDVTEGVLNDRFVIKTTVRDGVTEHALLYDLETEVDYLVDNDERISLRFWSGRHVTFDELIDKTVDYTPFRG